MGRVLSYADTARTLTRLRAVQRVRQGDIADALHVLQDGGWGWLERFQFLVGLGVPDGIALSFVDTHTPDEYTVVDT